MDASVFEIIRANLLAKQRNLAAWLQGTPAAKRSRHLGPAGEGEVHAHLRTLDAALSQATGQTLGLCTVCRDHVDRNLLEMDYTASVCLDHLSPDERRTLEDQLELSQVVQRALLPHQLPSIPGVELAVFSRPAQIVGGDCFDFYQYRDGAYGLAIADVADHGIAAGMLMASVQTALRTLVPQGVSPADVAEQLNRFFCHNVHFTTFVTLFLGRLEPATHALTYCNAGHNAPLLWQAGRAAWLAPTGAAIGLVEDSRAAAESASLAPGDVLLLYTDGVTEARNRQAEQFGSDRLAALVREHTALSAPELVQALRQQLHVFADGQPLADDTTVVACKFDEQPPQTEEGA